MYSISFQLWRLKPLRHNLGNFMGLSACGSASEVTHHWTFYCTVCRTTVGIWGIAWKSNAETKSCGGRLVSLLDVCWLERTGICEQFEDFPLINILKIALICSYTYIPRHLISSHTKFILEDRKRGIVYLNFHHMMMCIAFFHFEVSLLQPYVLSGTAHLAATNRDLESPCSWQRLFMNDLQKKIGRIAVI